MKKFAIAATVSYTEALGRSFMLERQECDCAKTTYCVEKHSHALSLLIVLFAE